MATLLTLELHPYWTAEDKSHLQAGNGILVSCNALLQRADLPLQRRAFLTQAKHVCSEVRCGFLSCLFCFLQTISLIRTCSSSEQASHTPYTCLAAFSNTAMITPKDSYRKELTSAFR